MATTYEAIATVIVGSGGAASIDFSSIPATYTDLVIKTSLRAVNTSAFLRLRFNSDSSNIYTFRWVYGTGSVAASTSGTDTAINWIDAANSNTTANTFSNGEIYIPNYASSNNKSVSIDNLFENNATAATAGLVAGLWSNSASISSLSLYVTSGNLAQYSTATLYGIKNS